MLLAILLTVHILVCIGLIGVVLLQRSEGGALGMGGGPTGFMTARGAGDLLTRITWILFTLFLLLSISLTILSGRQRAGSSVADRETIQALDPSKLNKPPAAPTPTLGTVPGGALPGEPGGLAAPTPQLRLPGEPAPAPAAPLQ